jgi:hypothetical protein
MLKQAGLKNVKITGEKMNEQVTIPAVYRHFDDSGRIGAFKLKWRKGQPKEPHFFWDSDVAKWIEGAAYTLAHKRDENLENLIDSIIDDIADGQTPEGYFNIYYQIHELGGRFTNRDNHELYCAGHLLEGAIAYKKATGKDKFLNAMIKYADYITEVFTDEKRTEKFRTPGHQEIELALVKLYHETGEKKYLDLGRFFIDNKSGGKEQTIDWLGPVCTQDHLPVAEQITAEGHSVRCLYMFAGAADIAREYNDEKLQRTCEAVFENIINKRMYVTGGLGGNYHGEAFSYDYDLPNELAYAETCASIAMIFFCQRMYLTTGEKKYIDAIELQLYNGFMSGVSLIGDRFFYCNPLEVHPERRDYFSGMKNAQFAPEYTRPDYFWCSCCPPNVIRLISSIGQYMYHVDEDDNIYVNLYNSSEFEHNGVKIIQETDYPRNGKVNFKIFTDKPVTVYLRIPDWCKNHTGENGYICIKSENDADFDFDFNFDMPVVELYANPKVHYCAGRVAVKRGPIVYCAESTDNGENLKSAKISATPNFICEPMQIEGNDIIKITCDGEIITETSDVLYSEKPFEPTKKRLALIPYAAWANRGRSEMLVWLMK